MENMMKKYDVVALGELLIDFTENGKSNQGNPLFEANPGGAPCNVLAMLTKLGHKTAFIGKVGEDFFGEQLRDVITEVGIDAKGNPYNTGNGAYLSGWRQRFLILSKSGSRHDVE